MTLDHRTRRPAPDLVVGGAPVRVLRLGPGGAGAVDALARGLPAGAVTGGRRLARRLADAGIAHPRPHPATLHRGDVAVVIPVRDRPAGLAATLAGLRCPDGVEIIVVDDGSVDRAAIAAAVRGAGIPARLLRHQVAAGPAAARNTGWRATSAATVAFIDADCIPGPGWLQHLVGHFDDPALGAVAPRITSRDATSQSRRRVAGARRGRLARYESARSPLDLGSHPSPVNPGSRVPYVPTAALAVRRDALDRLGGFDERMRVGEDVDLVWRLAGLGWRVRYDPTVAVAHPARTTTTAWLRQRFDYGTSAGPLAVRHGGAVAPAILRWPAAGTWVAGCALGPLAGLAAAAASNWGSASRIVRRSGLPPGVAARMAVDGHLWAGRALSEALRRPWWPAAIVALWALPPVRRRRLAAGLIVPLIIEWQAAGRPVDLASWVGMRVADDVAYGTGVIVGSLRARTWDALVPRLLP